MSSVTALNRPPVVMKFGGSSLGTLKKIQAVARIVVHRAALEPVVVVVSAMGRTTNELLDLAHQLANPPPPRELDMLLSTGERQCMALMAIAIAGLGKEAVSLTGSQCGIITDHQPGRARVIEVRPFRIIDELSSGRIVVVGGFQGVSYKRDVTTLGRGGSDTSAVALEAALGGDCEIYSDVDGVYSADPREVESAHRLEEMSYEEMEALASAGAKVLHVEAVRLAQERGVAVYARATAGGPGETVIRHQAARVAGLRAIAAEPVAAIELACTGGFLPSTILQDVGALGLRYLSVGRDRILGFLPVARRTDGSIVMERLGEIARGLGDDLDAVRVDESVALVSCVGSGLDERPQLVADALAVLQVHQVPVLGLHSDNQTVAFLVANHHRSRTCGLLHDRLVKQTTN